PDFGRHSSLPCARSPLCTCRGSAQRHDSGSILGRSSSISSDGVRSVGTLRKRPADCSRISRASAGTLLRTEGCQRDTSPAATVEESSDRISRIPATGATSVVVHQVVAARIDHDVLDAGRYLDAEVHVGPVHEDELYLVRAPHIENERNEKPLE